MIIPSEAAASLRQTKSTGVTGKRNVRQKSRGVSRLVAHISRRKGPQPRDCAPLKSHRESSSSEQSQTQGGGPALLHLEACPVHPLGQVHQTLQGSPGQEALTPAWAARPPLCSPSAAFPSLAGPTPCRTAGVGAAKRLPSPSCRSGPGTSLPLRPTRGSTCCFRETASRPGESHLSE